MSPRSMSPCRSQSRRRGRPLHSWDPPRVSELVVPGPLLLVGEDAVRLVHFLEFGLCGLVPGLTSGWYFSPAFGKPFYFIVRSALAHAQDFIVITFLFWHNITNF